MFVKTIQHSDYNGFISEKILHAFAAKTIPIYYGDPLICRQFNPNSFINCRDFSSIDEVVKRVAEIDENDDLFIDMLKEPIFLEENYVHDMKEQIKHFLFSIFDRDIEFAFRRPRVFIPLQHEHHLSFFYKTYSVLDSPRRIYRMIKQ